MSTVFSHLDILVIQKSPVEYPDEIVNNTGFPLEFIPYLIRVEMTCFFNQFHPCLSDDTQLAELNFLGSLVVAGCDRGMIERLLHDLKKPYQYRLDRTYYDWSSQRWSVLPEEEEFDEEEEISQDWIDELISRLEADIQDAFENEEDK